MAGPISTAGLKLVRRALRTMGLELHRYRPMGNGSCSKAELPNEGSSLKLRSALDRSLPRRPAPFVLAATNHGTLIVNRNDYYQQGTDPAFGVGFQLFETSCCEYDEVLLALALLSQRKSSHGPGVIALDCGANIGVHTVEWARHMHDWGSVIAIEAQERLFYALCGNITINNCLNAKGVWAALGASVGQLQIPVPNYCKPASFGSLELRPRPFGENIGQDIDYSDKACQSVAMTTIDNFALQRLDLLKIDVEGMEMEVLSGARITINKHRPIMIIEIIKSDRTEITSFLSSNDYKYYPFAGNILAAHRSDPISELISEAPGKLEISFE